MPSLHNSSTTLPLLLTLLLLLSPLQSISFSPSRSLFSLPSSTPSSKASTSLSSALRSPLLRFPGLRSPLKSRFKPSSLTSSYPSKILRSILPSSSTITAISQSFIDSILRLDYIASVSWTAAWKSFRFLAVGVLIMSLFTNTPKLPNIKNILTEDTSSQLDLTSPTSLKKFTDVVGIDEAKSELTEIVSYLRNPALFTRLGGKLPKGLLLTGPPGTGKTLLGKAIAGEANVPFFYASASSFEEMYVGVGARRVRDLFKAAKKKSPSIVFIDEIDAIGGKRNTKESSSMRMTLNELLVQMDGFVENSGVIVIGATNFPRSLDEALLRPGRFDKRVIVPLPDVKGRQEILELYASKSYVIGKDVNLNTIARGTPGMSGADLYNLINQAALKSSIDGNKSITQSSLEYIKDKILMGSERKSAVISPTNLRITAYHEAGHALMAIKTAGAHPVHLATIMPRGNALGLVLQLPLTDQISVTLKQLRGQLDVLMGGRVAEQIVFGDDEVTSGASMDIKMASDIARRMVTEYGFSTDVGIVYYGDEEKGSEFTQMKIDEEVKRIIKDSYTRAIETLTKFRGEHTRLADCLIQFESLSGAECIDIVERGIFPVRGVGYDNVSVGKEGGVKKSVFDLVQSTPI